jgi:hypothetical protein
MKNTITHIRTEKSYKEMQEYCSDANTFTVEIDGMKVRNRAQYFSRIWEAFDFQPAMWPNFDGYADWMSGLCEIGEKNVAIIIYNYKYFMVQDLEGKHIIEEFFRDDLLPYWEKDVVDIMVEGKPRRYNVYLIDGD